MPLALFVLDVNGPVTRLGAGEGPDLTRYFTVLGILLLAIVGLAFGFKKLFAGALRAKAARRHLSIVDVLPLGGKQRLAVVRCYDRTFALGMGEKEVALIAELDSVNTAGHPQAASERADQADFGRLLDRARADEDVQRSAARAPTAKPTSQTSIGKRVRQLLGANGVLG